MSTASTASSSSSSVSRSIDEHNWFNDIFGHEEGKNFLSHFLTAYSVTKETESTGNHTSASSSSSSSSSSSTVPSTAALTAFDDDYLYDEIVSSIYTKDKFPVGHFFTPTLQEMIEKVHSLYTIVTPQLRKITKNTSSSSTSTATPSSAVSPSSPLSLQFHHLPVTDILSLHAQKPSATIQAASQFNCLEFVSSNILPEHGITGYAYDYTQGPACALACAGGTLYRNYFVKLTDHTNIDNVAYHYQGSSLSNKNTNTLIPPVPSIGQNKHYQIHTLDSFEGLIQNKDHRYFYVKNGYLQSTSDNLTRLNMYLSSLPSKPSSSSSSALPLSIETLRQSIKVGVHSNVGVVLRNRSTACSSSDISTIPRITQVYCSAIPMCHFIADDLWEPLSCLILEAAYELTIYTGIYRNLLHYLQRLIRSSTGNPSLSNIIDTIGKQNYSNEIYLTLLGGGVFANPYPWILGSIAKAYHRVHRTLQEWEKSLETNTDDTDSSSNNNSNYRTFTLPPINVNLCHYRYVNDDIVEDLTALLDHYRNDPSL